MWECQFIVILNTSNLQIEKYAVEVTEVNMLEKTVVQAKNKKASKI